MAHRGPRRDQQARRRAQTVGAIGVLLAAALPVVLWHRVVADIARAGAGQSFGLRVAGWAPWLLMLLGLACAIPVAVAWWRNREGRFYSAGTGAWKGWGVSLYLLGFGLATQVAQIHGVGG